MIGMRLGNVVWKRASSRRRRERVLIPNLADKLMKITCAARASIFQDYVIGWATAPASAARFSPLRLGKLETAFWYHFRWQLGRARGCKRRDTLYGRVHNTDPHTKIRQRFEMPKMQTKKRGNKRGDWETRQSWLIPPPSLPFSINWTHSYLMHF